MFSLKVKTHLEVGGGFRVASAASGLVKEVTENIEEEKYGEQVQEGEKALVIMEGGVVSDHLWGQERQADDDQQERVQEGARDEQTRPEKCFGEWNLCLPLCQFLRWPIFVAQQPKSISRWLELTKTFLTSLWVNISCQTCFSSKLAKS